MILCLDVGNTHIFGGIYDDGKLQMQFRYPSSGAFTSDQLGIFFKSVLRENDVDIKQITKVAICSVVPALDYTIRAAFLKYFSMAPFFLHISNAANLKVDFENPHEIGADRLSAAIAAIHQHPHKNIIVIDLGTATTFDAISKDGVYLGGMIMPGISICMKSLSENTAKLSSVPIVKPDSILGQTTTANIQAGLYYMHLGAMHEIIKQITGDVFRDNPPVVIGTGGFSHLFEDEHLFTSITPELVLDGLQIAVEY